MLHSKRIWSIAPAESAEGLAEQLTQFTWCGCNGFRLSEYVFVNDATCADGAQEYAALRQDGDHFIQSESLTFSWMNYENALSMSPARMALRSANLMGFRNRSVHDSPMVLVDQCAK